MNKSLLVAIDGSYVIYYAIFRAIRIWSSRNKREAKPYLELKFDGSQSDLIDSTSFKTALYDAFIHVCYSITDIIENNFPQYRGYDQKGYATMLFCEDDFTSNSFRRKIYSDYKGGRVESKARLPYNLNKIRNYFTTVIFDQSDIWERTGYKDVFVDGAEGDDIIYEAMTKFGPKYQDRVIIAADKDLLQIPDAFQFNLDDKMVKRVGKNGLISASDFLKMKILIGDGSDNIPQVFPKVGLVRAEKIINEAGKLDKMLSENKEASERYEMNTKLMDISKMPEELSKAIDSKIADAIKNDASVDEIDESIFGEPIIS